MWVHYSYEQPVLIVEQEAYRYRADGQLDKVYLQDSSWNYQDAYAPPGGTGALRARYTRDALGRVTLYEELSGASTVYSREAAYDARSQLTWDRVSAQVTSTSGTDTNVSTSTYSYAAALNGAGLWEGVAAGGSYMGGVVTRVETDTLRNGSDDDAPDTRTVHAFRWGAGAVAMHTSHDGDTGSSANALWDTWHHHDAFGNLVSATIDDGRDRTVTLVNDAEGRVLQRDEADALSTGDPRELHYYFNGLRVGDIGNNGTSNIDYAASLSAHRSATGYGPFRQGSGNAAPHADFDQSYDAINGLTYESTASQYAAQDGDTLSGIAAAVWGDASLWYLIAEANGLDASSALVAGQLVTIPNKVHNSRNAADSWRPYDPNEALGDLSPTAARKPRKADCGVFGQILMVAIAVAVSLVLPGSGGIVGAALNGAIGSTVSQVFGVAVGIQEKFSFKAVALAALTAGVAQGISQAAASLGQVSKGLAGVGKFLSGSSAGAAAVRGVLANGITQGIAVATGLQGRFDFAGMAAAGVVAGVGQAVAAELPGSLNPTMGQFVAGMAGGIAGAATRSLITGTDFGDNLIAVLPDVIGSTIGRMMADGLASAGRRSYRDEKAYGIEDGKAAQSAPSQNAQNADQNASSEEIVVTARRKEPFDPGFRLGPNDRYDEPSGFERFIAKLTPWKDRVDRIDRMRALIDAGDYDTIIAENFKITTESDATSNWTDTLTQDDARAMGDSALRELFNTRTGHRILVTIASQANYGTTCNNPLNPPPLAR